MFGLAGNDWPSDHDRLAAIPASLGLGGVQEIVNDAFVALRAGANHPWGVVVVAGTGTVVAGRNEAGEEFRTLGLGPMFGDWGGSAEISEEAIRGDRGGLHGPGPGHVVDGPIRGGHGSQLDRRSPRVRQPAAPAHRPTSRRSCSRPPRTGTRWPRSIAERAGTSLGANAGLVTRRLGMHDRHVEVVLAGGVLRAGSRILEQALKKELRRSAPAAFPVRLEVPPVVGAALRALENLGRSPDSAEHLRLSVETMRALDYGFV